MTINYPSSYAESRSAIIKGLKMIKLSVFKRNILNRFRYPIIFSILSIGLSTLYFNSTSTCDFKITGYLKVKSEQVPVVDELMPLADLPIMYHGLTKPGEPNHGKIFSTDKNGRFSYSTRLSGNACSNGVTVKIDSSFAVSDELQIFHGGTDYGSLILGPVSLVPTILADIILSPGQVWDRVGHKKCMPGDCDFGELTFKSTATSNNSIVRSEYFVRRRADLWWASKFVLDNATFHDTVKIAYPHNIWGVDILTARASFADPSTRIISIIHASDEINDFEWPLHFMLFHELGHIWAYERAKNPMELYWYFLNLFNLFNTHGIVSNPSVAFHEGFADVFGNAMFRKLLLELEISYEDLDDMYLHPSFDKNLPERLGYCDSDKAQTMPFSFNECNHNGEGTLDCCDYGWSSMLKGLNLGKFNDSLVEHEAYKDIIFYDFKQHTTNNPRFLYDGLQNPELNFLFEEAESNDLIDFDSINSSCHTDRPKLSFRELLQAFEEYPNKGLDYIDSEDMTIDGFINRLIKIGFQDITSEGLDLYKEAWDIGTQDTLKNTPINYYCKPQFLLEKPVANIDPNDSAYFKRPPNTNFYVGELNIRSKVLSGFDIEDIAMYVNPEVTSGIISISELEDDDPLSKYSLINTYEAGNEQLNALRPAVTHELTYRAYIDLAPNGSFPLTTLTWQTQVGCPDDFQKIGMEGSNTEDIWEEKDCELNGDESINLFPDQVYTDEWETNSQSITLAADYKPKIIAYMHDGQVSSSYSPKGSNINIFDSIIPTASARRNESEWRNQFRANEQINRGYQDLSPQNESRGSNDNSPELTTGNIAITKKHYVTCGVSNIGNVDPNHDSTVKLYTYSGPSPSEDPADWSFVGSQDFPSIIPRRMTFLPSWEIDIIHDPNFYYQSPFTQLTKDDPPFIFAANPVWAKCVVDEDEDIQESNENNNSVITKLRGALYIENPAWDLENLPNPNGSLLTNIALAEIIKAGELHQQIQSLIIQESYKEIDEIRAKLETINTKITNIILDAKRNQQWGDVMLRPILINQIINEKYMPQIRPFLNGEISAYEMNNRLKQKVVAPMKAEKTYKRAINKNSYKIEAKTNTRMRARTRNRTRTRTRVTR